MENKLVFQQLKVKIILQRLKIVKKSFFVRCLDIYYKYRKKN
jgi:hypothetical protein